MTFTALGHTSARSAERFSGKVTLPGVAAKKSLQALLKWLFSDLKTAMSNGYRICVQ